MNFIFVAFERYWVADFFIYLTFRLLTILGKQWLNTDLVPPFRMVCPRLAISFSYLPDFPHKAQVYPEHRFSERYSSLSNKPRYMFNNTISQLNAEQWSRTYTLWLPWHQLIHCYLDNCKFLYTYQLTCTLTILSYCFLKLLRQSLKSTKFRTTLLILFIFK